MDREISHDNTNQKTTRFTTLISERADPKARKVIRIKEHYIMIKGSSLQDSL